MTAPSAIAARGRRGDRSAWRATSHRPWTRIDVVLQRRGWSPLAHPARSSLAAVVLAAITGAAIGRWWGMGIGAVVGFCAPWVGVGLIPDRRHDQMAAQVPALLDALARCERAGLSLATSFGAASKEVPDPLRTELMVVLARVEAGVGLRESLGALTVDRRCPAMGTLVAAVDIAVHTGGASAQALDNLAASIRARESSERELRAATTGARYSATVIAAAPLVMAAVLLLVDPATAGTAFGHGAGRLSVGSGVVFDLVGLCWIRRLMAFDSAPTLDIVRGARLPSDASPPPHCTRELAELADLLAVALVSGHSVVHALDQVCRSSTTDTAAIISRSLATSRETVSSADALAALPDVLGEPSRPLFAALVATVRYGAPIVPALERVAFELRLARRIETQARTKRTSVLLLFPLVLCVLPAFVLLTVVPMVLAALSALPGAGL